MARNKIEKCDEYMENGNRGGGVYESKMRKNLSLQRETGEKICTNLLKSLFSFHTPHVRRRKYK